MNTDAFPIKIYADIEGKLKSIQKKRAENEEGQTLSNIYLFLTLFMQMLWEDGEGRKNKATAKNQRGGDRRRRNGLKVVQKKYDRCRY